MHRRRTVHALCCLFFLVQILMPVFSTDCKLEAPDGCPPDTYCHKQWDRCTDCSEIETHYCGNRSEILSRFPSCDGHCARLLAEKARTVQEARCQADIESLNATNNQILLQKQKENEDLSKKTADLTATVEILNSNLTSMNETLIVAEHKLLIAAAQKEEAEQMSERLGQELNETAHLKESELKEAKVVHVVLSCFLGLAVLAHIGRCEAVGGRCWKAVKQRREDNRQNDGNSAELQPLAEPQNPTNHTVSSDPAQNQGPAEPVDSRPVPTAPIEEGSDSGAGSTNTLNSTPSLNDIQLDIRRDPADAKQPITEHCTKFAFTPSSPTVDLRAVDV